MPATFRPSRPDRPLAAPRPPAVRPFERDRWDRIDRVEYAVRGGVGSFGAPNDVWADADSSAGGTVVRIDAAPWMQRDPNRNGPLRSRRRRA